MYQPYLLVHHAPDRVVGLSHEILADQSVAVGQAIRKLRAGGVQQQAWTLDRVAGDDHVLRFLKTPPSLAIVIHAGRATLRTDLDPPDHRQIAHLRARRQRTRQPHVECALLGIGRAADAAEAAVHAGGREAARSGDGGKRRGHPIYPKLLAAPRQNEARRVHLVCAIWIAPARRSPRIAERPRDLQRLFDFVVVAPHLPPIERPIDAVAELCCGT